jgi:hypothetical protein
MSDAPHPSSKMAVITISRYFNKWHNKESDESLTDPPFLKDDCLYSKKTF